MSPDIACRSPPRVPAPVRRVRESRQEGRERWRLLPSGWRRPASPPSALQAKAWGLSSASQGLLCVQPGKRPRSLASDAGRRVENLKVTNPRANGGGGRAVDRLRPGAEGSLCAAVSLTSQQGGAWRGGRPVAGRTQGGLTPGRREFRVRAQRRDCVVPGSQERRALGPELLRTRRTSTQTARSPESGPGPECVCVCVCVGGVG